MDDLHNKGVLVRVQVQISRPLLELTPGSTDQRNSPRGLSVSRSDIKHQNASFGISPIHYAPVVRMANTQSAASTRSLTKLLNHVRDKLIRFRRVQHQAKLHT